ncbi:hypothetical protein NSPZN2_100030 [Nitrospira defluvii]|uniref:Uncharacterized protein n=1 Tax=Nitrospira defluvii TaxID=330214 RepID=A0ABM8QZ88_9BACT|nr:hypothetical protein NSPZN2_100030 [Nitrospira defluvii]
MTYHAALLGCDQDNVPDHSALGKSLGLGPPDGLTASMVVPSTLLQGAGYAARIAPSRS